jgi:acyl carrier protein
MSQLDQITHLICRIGSIPPIGPDDNIYRCGFASMKALELLVELEAEYEVTIPDEQFMAAQSPRDLSALVAAS